MEDLEKLKKNTKNSLRQSDELYSLLKKIILKELAKEGLDPKSMAANQLTSDLAHCLQGKLESSLDEVLSGDSGRLIFSNFQFLAQNTFEDDLEGSWFKNAIRKIFGSNRN